MNLLQAVEAVEAVQNLQEIANTTDNLAIRILLALVSILFLGIVSLWLRHEYLIEKKNEQIILLAGELNTNNIALIKVIERNVGEGEKANVKLDDLKIEVAKIPKTH